jgi:hypothetical protein
MRQSGLKRMKVNLHRCGAHYEGACGAQRDDPKWLQHGACVWNLIPALVKST